jgi:hypothetical protein
MARLPCSATDMPLLLKRKARPQESPRASEVGDWLDVKIASLRREIDQEGESRADAPERAVARRVRRLIERPRARRPAAHRGGAGTAWSRIMRGAARFTRAHVDSIVFYGLAVALALLVGWFTVFLANHY